MLDSAGAGDEDEAMVMLMVMGENISQNQIDLDAQARKLQFRSVFQRDLKMKRVSAIIPFRFAAATSKTK